jgi:putative ABC transport system substrate-binding protein
MRRRKFIRLLSGAAVGWPLAAHAQQSAMPVIGFLNGGSADSSRYNVRAFHKGLRETGYVEGQNVAIEYRWAEGHNDRLPLLTADLVRRQVTVVTTGGTPAALAAKAATTTIPIVFEMGSDPVRLGLVASLSRPGGNITGVTNVSVAVGPKQLELMDELLPTATIMALLINPTNPAIADAISRDVQATARTLGLQLHVLHASTEQDFEAAFSSVVQLRAGGLLISSDLFFNSRINQAAALMFRHAVPTIYPIREFVEVGGLMSYGSRFADAFRLVGRYTGRILKGEKPADLPVVESAEVELIINLKTANALGITIPPSIMVRADEVIE